VNQFYDPEAQNVSDPPLLSGMDDEECEQAIFEWFCENFEDPQASVVPYDADDRAFTFIWGGPFRPDKIIVSHFPDLASDVRQRLSERLNGIAPRWSPAVSRLRHMWRPLNEPPSDVEDEKERVPASWRQAHQELASRLDMLEIALKSVEPVPPGIGGNYPPEEVGLPPYDEDQRSKLFEAIRLLRQIPQNRAGFAPSKAIDAVETLKEKEAGFGSYTKRLADKYLMSLAESAGKETATLVKHGLFWALIIHEAISHARQAAEVMLSIIGR